MIIRLLLCYYYYFLHNYALDYWGLGVNSLLCRSHPFHDDSHHKESSVEVEVHDYDVKGDGVCHLLPSGAPSHTTRSADWPSKCLIISSAVDSYQNIHRVDVI